MTIDEVAKLSDEDFLKATLDSVGRELGPYGLARFISLVHPGSGDYTRDRHLWLGEQTADAPDEAESHTRAA